LKSDLRRVQTDAGPPEGSDKVGNVHDASRLSSAERCWTARGFRLRASEDPLRPFEQVQNPPIALLNKELPCLHERTNVHLCKLSTTTIALLNQKGGVGKTSLAVNLGAAAHLEGRRTLLVDMDRQGSAFEWSSARREGSRLDGLTVVRADRALPAVRLREMGAGYDVVILDGPPRLGDVTRSAACAADLVLIPVQPGPFDLWATSETLELLDSADALRIELGRPAVVRSFVINRAGAGTVLARATPGALTTRAPVAGVVHQRIVFAESSALGEAVLTREPRGAAAREIASLWKAIGRMRLGRPVTEERNLPCTDRS
jgi:chromosome partitioning protein